MPLLQFLVCSCLILAANAAIPDRFVALPPELGSKAPARLVFSVADLAQCWNDDTARRCVLRAPIRFDEPTWRTSFASTGGIAVQAPPLPTLTLTSEPCSASGGCLGGTTGGNNSSSVDSQQQILDLNEIPGLIMVGSGSTLLLNNLFLNNVAYKSSYVRTDYQPYRTEGAGTGLWPSIQFAPNSTLLVFNSSVTYTNPSTLTCAEYTQRGLFSFQQAYGESNITSVNATTTKVVGPVNITVAVRDGRTDEKLGNSTSSYVNVTFTCMERPPPTTGPTSNTLAVAIAVPIAVVALAAGLTFIWCLSRRRTKQRAATLKDPSKCGPHYLKDIELGGGPGPGVAPGRHSSASVPDTASGLQVDQGRSAQVETVGSMPYSYGGSSLLWSSPSGLTAGTASFGPEDAEIVVGGPSGASSSQQTAQPAVHHAAAVGVGPAGGQAIRAAGSLGWQRARRLSGRYLQPVDLPRVSTASSQDETAHLQYPARGPDSVTPVPSIATGSRQQSASTTEPGTPKNSLEMQLLAANRPASMGTGPGSSSSGDDRRSAVYALLKARSDVAVLRDLRIGPLLGRGSYGRVYRGRWKATTVAVKIIEHYGVDAEASTGSRRVSAGREMLFATSISHPNVVTTFHISTMTINQRSALAKSWLADSKTPEEPGQEADAAAADAASDADDNSDGSGSDSSEAGSPPDLLETWIIMEFCERGSLERALKLCKFKARDGLPEMIGIYKALLDTASGLDYLHSIGVVHGDLKTANVLLKGNTRDAQGVTCKITDFGLSKVLDNENQTHISTGTYGTIVYMPKELLLSGRMTQATDIYSFGLMMWELLTSQPIMDEGLSIGQMFYMIAYQDWRPQVPEGCPPGYADLMVSCWQEDPEQRPTAQQLLRRLQLLYVKAKQQLLAADRDSRPSSSRRVRAAAAAPGRPLLDSTASGQNDGRVASSPLRVSLEMDAAAAAVRLTDQQQRSLQPQRHTETQAQVPAGASPPLGSPFAQGAGWEGAAGFDTGHSPAAGSSNSSKPAASSTTSKGRNSNESQGGAEEQVVYEPFVHAVLHRATSLSVPAMTSPTPRHNTPPAQAAAAAAPATAAAFAQYPGTAAQVVKVPELKPISVGGPGSHTTLVPQHEYHHQQQQQPLVLQPVQQHNGLIQLLPGGAFLDPASFPAPPLAPAEDLIAFEAFNPSSAELYSDSQLQHLTNSSNAMHSGASHEAFADLHYGRSGRPYIEGFADPPAVLPPLQQQWQQQQQPAAAQQLCQWQQLRSSCAVLPPAAAAAVLPPAAQQLVYSMPQVDPLQQPAAAAAAAAAAPPPQQQQAGGVYGYKDFLPLPPGARDFSVTEKYIATIEWAARPEVQAAAAAAAAQNLAAMRAQAEANGTLHLLPSFIRDPWQLAPAPVPQYSAGQGFAGCLPDFPDPDDPEGQDRIRLYIQALDMARTPSETIAVTDAIIADAVAVDDAVRAAELDLEETSGQQGAGGDGVGPEDDAAVLLDGLTELEMPRDAASNVAFTQPACFASQPAAQLVGSAGAAGASAAAGEGLRGGSSSAVVNAQAAQAANQQQQHGGGGGSSSSANALLSGGGYSTSTSGQRSFGSSSGAGPTYSSNLFSSAAHNSPADDQQQQQLPQGGAHHPSVSTAAGPTAAAAQQAAARFGAMQHGVRAASLHGPLRSFAGGQAQPATAIPAAPNTSAATADPSADYNSWAVVPDHPDSSSAGITMASGAAAGAVTSATGSTSGSFAAWARSEPPEELVGVLSVVDERGP